MKIEGKYWINYLNGDNHSLGHLYDSLFEPLVLKAIYYTKDPNIARDIVSNLFVYLIELSPKQRIERWEQHSNFEFLLLAIVRNKCLDYLKTKRIHERIELEIEKNSPFIQEEKELMEQLEACLNELTENERTLINLHLDGFDNREIALKMDISEKTVRNKLSLTRKVLFNLWGKFNLILVLIWI